MLIGVPSPWPNTQLRDSSNKSGMTYWKKPGKTNEVKSFLLFSVIPHSGNQSFSTSHQTALKSHLLYCHTVAHWCYVRPAGCHPHPLWHMLRCWLTSSCRIIIQNPEKHCPYRLHIPTLSFYKSGK